MKKVIFLFLIMIILGVSVFAQKAKPKTAALPADIVNWNGEDSDKILKNPIIKIRLKKLLGAKNYTSFMESFETLNPIKKTGDTLFTGGCLIHACTHLESAIAINLTAKTIHAAIYRDEQKTKYFNERSSKTPKSIADWAKRLNRLKKM